MTTSLNQSLAWFMNEAIDLTLYERYGAALSAFCQKPTLRVAGIGVDSSLFRIAEDLIDSRLKIIDYFAGNPGDVFFKNKPIEELRCADYDLLIVGADSQDDEDVLLQKLSTYFSGANILTCPVLLLRKFRSGVKMALAKAKRIDTCLTVQKLSLVAHALFSTYDGCILECGSFKCGTTVFMGLLLREWGDARRVYALDTFAGMPASTAPDRETDLEGLFTDTSFEGVTHYVQEHGLGQQTTLVKGLVQDTLPEVLSREPHVSFALVDTDQYQGTLSSLKLIVPKLQENGIILVDDYLVEGVKTAVAEVQEQYTMLGGAKLSSNFYMLWNRTNRYFLSSCQVC